MINGRIFQPWLADEEKREKFKYDRPFCDPDGLLPLSKKHVDSGAVYRRPREFIADAAASFGLAYGNDLKPVMIESINPLSITQELVADCSFVCSLCIAAAFEAKFRKQLITKIIFPQSTRGIPVYNASGKYLVKLYVNGVQRKVVVDDRLPVDPSGRYVSMYPFIYVALAL
jgi:calpain-7